MTLPACPYPGNDRRCRVARPDGTPFASGVAHAAGAVQGTGRISHRSGFYAGRIVLLPCVAKKVSPVWLSSGKQRGNLGGGPCTIRRTARSLRRQAGRFHARRPGDVAWPATTHPAGTVQRQGGVACAPPPTPRLRLRISHPGSRAVEFGVRGAPPVLGDPDRHPCGPRGFVIMTRDQRSVAVTVGVTLCDPEPFDVRRPAGCVLPYPSSLVPSPHGIHPVSPGVQLGESTPRSTPMHPESCLSGTPSGGPVVTELTCNAARVGAAR